MKRVKGVKEIFAKLSPDKTPLSIIHVDKEESEACFPFIIKPTAADYCLCHFIVAEPEHNKEKNITPPSVICIEKIRYTQQGKDTQKLHMLFILEIFYGTKGKVSKEQREKYVLLFIEPGVGVHKIPGYFGDTGKKKQITPIPEAVLCVEKAFHQ